MHTIVLTEKMFRTLASHIADVEKEKEAIIKSFQSESADTRMDIDSFFREYITTLDNYLKGAKIRKSGEDTCPLVIIGSTVEVRDCADLDVYSYHIVLPYAKKESGAMNNASCLSPMGRALLLKAPGSKVSIQTPSALLSYEVMSILLNDTVLEKDSLKTYSGQTTLAL